MTVGTVSRTWQIKRVIYSKDMIFFCAVDDEEVVDVIPIEEIVLVAKCEENVETSLQADLRIERKDLTTELNPKKLSALKIITHPDGYNSGREYVLQASTAEDCLTIVKELNILSKNAKKRAERKSKFQKSQAKLKVVFMSNAFHLGVSTMILMVYYFNTSNLYDHVCLDILVVLTELPSKRNRGTDRCDESRWVPK